MKKVFLFASLLVALAACTDPSYKITGTVEGGADGDKVYIESITGMNATVLDSTVLSGGKFSFKGRQDSTVLRYVSCTTKEEAFSAPFFLENGKIKVSLRKGGDSVTGTPANEIYQGIRSQITEVLRQMNDIYEEMEKDSTLTAEQKDSKTATIDSLEKRYSHVLKEGMRENMDNPVGIYLFKLWYFDNSLEENLELFDKIPEKYMTDPLLVKIKGFLERQKRTTVNAKYIDFTMTTPKGKKISLSDKVGKGKYVLLDFWASWCGPCRQSMPELKKVYSQYKDRLEIVGVSLDHKEEAWKKAISSLGLNWIHMSDLKGWKSEAAALYGVNSIPHALLIDNEGTIIARNLQPGEVAGYLSR